MMQAEGQEPGEGHDMKVLDFVLSLRIGFLPPYRWQLPEMAYSSHSGNIFF